MQLNNTTIADANMYLANTYMLYNGKPIRINYFYDEDLSDDDIMYGTVNLSYSTSKGNEYAEINTEEPFRLRSITLGYYNTDNAVIYVYKRQYNHYKKLPDESILQTYTPQANEFRHLNINCAYNLHKVLLAGTSHVSLEEAYKLVTNNTRYSVSLHNNYALVKKASHKHPVIYYKKDPVIVYDGTNLVPLINECHVTKFKLEMGLCD